MKRRWSATPPRRSQQRNTRTTLGDGGDRGRGGGALVGDDGTAVRRVCIDRGSGWHGVVAIPQGGGARHGGRVSRLRRLCDAAADHRRREGP
eukprot:4574199-Prymnesium_polylepis.1